MMRSRKFILDDGKEAEVDFCFRVLGWNELEITECDAWLWSDRNNVNAPTFKLNVNEMERLHVELHEDPSSWEYDYD